MLKQMTSKLSKRTLTGMSLALAALLLAIQPALAAGASFTIIVRSAFTMGDAGVGDDHEIDFSTPGVNAGRRAVLMVQTRDVDFTFNGVQINGTSLQNLVQHDTGSDESYVHMIIVPANVLRADQPNTLRLTSRNIDGNLGGNLDDFVVERVVIHYEVQ
jgi:hypothetical protein